MPLGLQWARGLGEHSEPHEGGPEASAWSAENLCLLSNRGLCEAPTQGRRLWEPGSEPSLLGKAARPMQGKKLGLSSWTSPGWRGAQGALARGSAYTRPRCRAACSFCGGKNLAVSGIQQHLQGRGPLGLNPSGAGEAYSMGIRNCTVSSGWAVPGRTSWMKKLVRKTRSWGLPSWYRGYLRSPQVRRVRHN